MTMPLLEWAIQAPWASVPELADFEGVNRSTTSRQLSRSLKSGLVVVKDDGRLLRPRDRVLASTLGVAEAFPEQHTHPFDGEDHDHHPFYPQWEDHAHPTYFNSYAGAELLWSRLEFVEIAYPLAPAALMGAGAKWTHDGRPRKLLSWRWLRHTKFVNAIAIYEDGYVLFFCWVGRSITVPMLQWRYQHRFQRLRDLEMSSEAEEMELRRHPIMELKDDDYDPYPQPSGWVIITPDTRGARIAAEVMPRGAYLRGAIAFLFAIGAQGGPRVYVGQAQPAPEDNVGDKFADVDIGVPEDLCH